MCHLHTNLMLTACMNSGANNSAAQPTPTATANFMPEVNGTAGTGTGEANQTSSGEPGDENLVRPAEEINETKEILEGDQL